MTKRFDAIQDEVGEVLNDFRHDIDIELRKFRVEVEDEHKGSL